MSSKCAPHRTVTNRTESRGARRASTVRSSTNVSNAQAVASTLSIGTAIRLERSQDDVRRPSRSARMFDLAVALPLFLVALPIIGLIMAATRLMSGRNVLFCQERVGLHGRAFRCYKIRTMEIDAEEKLKALLDGDPSLREEFESSRKLQHDPRITRIGRLLRVSGLDELPQLWNVLRGDMALVGPRPRAQSELDLCGPMSPMILSVRPGITGPWQLMEERHDIGSDARLAIETDYALTRTTRRDISLLLRTVWMFISMRLQGGC